jgi:hypothetical protein
MRHTMRRTETLTTGVAASRVGPVAYVPIPRVPVDGACATPEERL